MRNLPRNSPSQNNCSCSYSNEFQFYPRCSVEKSIRLGTFLPSFSVSCLQILPFWSLIHSLNRFCLLSLPKAQLTFITRSYEILLPISFYQEHLPLQFEHHYYCRSCNNRACAAISTCKQYYHESSPKDTHSTRSTQYRVAATFFACPL